MLSPISGIVWQGAPKVEQVADKSDRVADQPSHTAGRVVDGGVGGAFGALLCLLSIKCTKMKQFANTFCRILCPFPLK